VKNVIVGTAGHIDHGKTALVKALTGIDADRLAEEKRRGITIDLGFAHLDLTPEIRLGFVDVPGHERFVKNMLAGAGGIDIVMLVIAAGESIKPQTREHFDICRLLGVQSGLIALTKTDLVDPEIVELATLEIEEFVAGSFLAGAPVIPVSAKTGQGLAELRDALRIAATRVVEKNARGVFRLPIDRAFSMRGFGVVVTGTLLSGGISAEQEVMIYPERRRLRVRGVQVHGTAAKKAVAGQRTAINLVGIEAQEIARGMVLVEPDRFRAIREFSCVLEALPGAPPIKNHAPVHLHAGTAEIEAEVVLFRGETVLPPGARTYARILLREEALLLPRDRFIIRRFSPVSTIGGGVVLDIAPVRSRKSSEIKERLARIESASREEWVHLLIKESGTGLSPEELTARTGLTPGEIEEATRGNPSVLKLPGWLVDRNCLESLRETILQKIREFHRLHALLPGIPKQDLRPGLPDALFDAVLKHPQIAVEGEIVRHRSHRVVLQQQEEQARSAIEGAFEKAGLAAPALPEVLAHAGIESGRARMLLQILLKEGTLVRITDDLVLHRSALERLQNDLASIKGARMSVPEFKERTGISRKYAIPLLEYLDRQKITRREGDSRIVL
jgi:selenocysteine-specific elongation factor